MKMFRCAIVAVLVVLVGGVGYGQRAKQPTASGTTTSGWAFNYPTIMVRVEASQRIVIPFGVDGTTQVCVENDVSDRQDGTELCTSCVTVDEMRGYSYGSIHHLGGSSYRTNKLDQSSPGFMILGDGTIGPVPIGKPKKDEVKK